MPKVILLTGPPPGTSVPNTFIDHFDPAFESFIHRQPTDTNQPPATSSPCIVAWRSLPLKKQPLQTNLNPAVDFFSTAATTQHTNDSIQSQEQENELLTQFCEHSLSLTQFDHTGIEETSFITASNPSQPPPPPPVAAHLSDLEDIPSANQVTSLHPQTITLNIIAGVISIAQPRSVTTRWGQSLSLVELLLGDDTKSGFAVTFWLAADSASESEVGKLQRQDVVLLQNVALHVFRGKVYGQSLRRGMTKIHLLWRREGKAYYTMKQLKQHAKSDQTQPQLAKTKRVVDWVLRFVGANVQTTTTVQKAQHIWDRPPDHTQ